LAESVKASQTAATLARNRYDNGATDFLSVLDAERVLLAAQDQLAQTQTETATALVAVYKRCAAAGKIIDGQEGAGCFLVSFCFFSQALMSLAEISHPPLPLQSFWNLHAWASVLQPPIPLQSFCPAQSWTFGTFPAGAALPGRVLVAGSARHC
jgi:hypothetical protein